MFLETAQRVAKTKITAQSVAEVRQITLKSEFASINDHC